MCGSDLNNCEEGFSCVWDGQDNDVGICKSTYGNAIMTDISIWRKFRVVNNKVCYQPTIMRNLHSDSRYSIFYSIRITG